ncbi:uncharacterized protein LOC142233434 [Haematobia irritans]|uniref:uncharacterized protein LOC142233434 n=1 Tax=Haematobia irritans TaxID=7368 RepID=UPI003F4F9A95
MMTIDFLIFAVLIVSFVINTLALAAFWVTPGLRTTANRFTINLVIINLVGCVILAPTLFLSGGEYSAAAVREGSNKDGPTTITTGSLQSGLSFLSPNENDDSIEFYSKPGNHQLTIRHNGRLVEKEGLIVHRNSSSSGSGSSSHGDQKSNAANDGEGSSTRTIETIYKCNDTYCRELTIDESVDTLVITEIEEENISQPIGGDGNAATEDIEQRPWLSFQMRSWSIDMVAALGAMAVLLVVGDTWCAVTDPLRYHIRISGMKSWILIALTWSMGVLFGALSAFREIDFEADTTILKRPDSGGYTSVTSLESSSSNDMFAMVFSCLYFVLIVLLPFGFVCGMYWRIITEARENGLRIRQNGSSPLMQSSLNLMQGQHVSHLQQYASNNFTLHRSSISSTSTQIGGLQMRIDKKQQQQNDCDAGGVLLSPASGDGLSHIDAEEGIQHIDNNNDTVKINIHQNRDENVILTVKTSNVEIQSNFAVRRTEPMAHDLTGQESLKTLRQSHSTPNLQTHILNAEVCPFVQQGSEDQSCHPTQAALQMPTINTSPKALSYMSSLRHRLSNASSLFKYREESRAARISILVVIMFLVSYLPFGVLILLQTSIPAASTFPLSNELAIFMILLANLSSPFIFAYRNKRVRRGVKRILCCYALNSRENLEAYRSFNSRHKRSSRRTSAHSNNSSHSVVTPSSSLMIRNAANTSNILIRPTSTCSTIINLTINNNVHPCQRSLEKPSSRVDSQNMEVQSGDDFITVEEMPLKSRKDLSESQTFISPNPPKKLVCDAAYCGTEKAEPTEV